MDKEKSLSRKSANSAGQTSAIVIIIFLIIIVAAIVFILPRATSTVRSLLQRNRNNIAGVENIVTSPTPTVKIIPVISATPGSKSKPNATATIKPTVNPTLTPIQINNTIHGEIKVNNNSGKNITKVVIVYCAEGSVLKKNG
ncbi:hypothetical protein A2153_06150 [Candidatus Gottesmanbacteria bacterium RBG_16_38_7b]|uniref:Uncharacterized protein n=1 Tax=Candidatus Gottesmanbacteria bacterium RBG_16_38_7b TaxID=1798372 RepID=A0A1F5YI45_9BACT|nr:MAG: hypothetical protein A2153_06150 [Candidatus Gottesmanbacteria bacterium RBG_16_38_7b]